MVFHLPSAQGHFASVMFYLALWLLKGNQMSEKLKDRCQVDKHTENRQDTKLHYCNTLCASDTFKIYFDLLKL